jgi:hypothetical protein
VPEAAGFCVSKQPTSSPRCIRNELHSESVKALAAQLQQLVA